MGYAKDLYSFEYQVYLCIEGVRLICHLCVSDFVLK